MIKTFQYLGKDFTDYKNCVDFFSDFAQFLHLWPSKLLVYDQNQVSVLGRNQNQGPISVSESKYFFPKPNPFFFKNVSKLFKFF